MPHILRNKSSNGCHCGFTSSLLVCPFTTCGPSRTAAVAVLGHHA